jgi:uncharacterized protein (UPF0333 family)
MRLNKGQVSIEVIILLGILILGAIVVSILLIGSYEKNVTQADDVDTKVTNLVDGFVDDLDKDASPDFVVSVVNPIHLKNYNLSGNLNITIPFKVDSDYNQGSVICNWTVTKDGLGFTLNSCDTQHTFIATGDYTVDLNVSDGTSTRNRYLTFEIIDTGIPTP